jgi:hypothetical protein
LSGSPAIDRRADTDEVKTENENADAASPGSPGAEPPGYKTTPDESGSTSPVQRASLGSPAIDRRADTDEVKTENENADAASPGSPGAEPPGYPTTPDKSGSTSPFQRASLGSPAIDRRADTDEAKTENENADAASPGSPGAEPPGYPTTPDKSGSTSPFQRASFGSPAIDRRADTEPTAAPHATEDSSRYTLHRVYRTILQLFAPFFPFATEEIYLNLFADTGSPSIHRSHWPEPDPALESDAAEELGALLIEIASAVRGYKSRNNLPLRTEIPQLELATEDAELAETLRMASADLMSITRAQKITVKETPSPELQKLPSNEKIQIAISPNHL